MTDNGRNANGEVRDIWILTRSILNKIDDSETKRDLFNKILQHLIEIETLGLEESSQWGWKLAERVVSDAKTVLYKKYGVEPRLSRSRRAKSVGEPRRGDYIGTVDSQSQNEIKQNEYQSTVFDNIKKKKEIQKSSRTQIRSASASRFKESGSLNREVNNQIVQFESVLSRPCNAKQCLLCSSITTDSIFYSKSNNSAFEIKMKPGADYVTCSSSNVIYLIDCNKCSKQCQYVGQTKQTLKKSFNSHRLDYYKYPRRPLYSHFHIRNHSLNDMKVLILEQADPSVILVREQYWIDTLETLFPKGLNAKCVTKKQ